MTQVKKKHKQLLDLPRHVQDAIIPDLLRAIEGGHGGFASSYLLSELLSKYVGKDTAPASVRRDAAIEKWLHVERLNQKTNNRLMLLSILDRPIGNWTSYGRLVRRVRSLIQRVLGPVDTSAIFKRMCYTNGASTRVRRSANAALHKLTGRAHITSDALNTWLEAVYRSDTGRHILAGQDLELQENSVLFTVPKKSDIDRVACKEPEVNMLMQRSVGVYIRQRLMAKAGINLRDQTINQRLAARAYSDGLATIDLSSASDTVTTELVDQLLPADWSSLLHSLRVKRCFIPSTKTFHDFEMFSTMGNGFTFELETLIFWAITIVVCKDSGIGYADVSVYGDDIIAPSRVVPRLLLILQMFGFMPNQKKTHFRGKFRESCGKHYYGDFDVTPFYIRRPVSTLPDLIRLLNRVMEWDAASWGFMTTPSLVEFHVKYSAYVPRHIWGGVDPASPYALVTGHLPRKRLTPITKEITRDDTPALKYWIMSKGQGSRLESLDVTDWDDLSYLQDAVDFLEHDLDGVEVSPYTIVGYKLSRCSKGWHTSWNPWLIAERTPKT